MIRGVRECENYCLQHDKCVGIYYSTYWNRDGGSCKLYGKSFSEDDTEWQAGQQWRGFIFVDNGNNSDDLIEEDDHFATNGVCKKKYIMKTIKKDW